MQLELPRYGGGQNCHIHLAIPNPTDRKHKTSRQMANEQPKHQREDNMEKKLTPAFGAPVDDNQNIATAGERGPALLQHIWCLDQMARCAREVLPERRMPSKGSVSLILP